MIKSKETRFQELSHLSPPVVPMRSWNWPEYPWQSNHLDYAGPFMGEDVPDVHSKCMEVEMVNLTTA